MAMGKDIDKLLHCHFRLTINFQFFLPLRAVGNCLPMLSPNTSQNHNLSFSFSFILRSLHCLLSRITLTSHNDNQHKGYIHALITYPTLLFLLTTLLSNPLNYQLPSVTHVRNLSSPAYNVN